MVQKEQLVQPERRGWPAVQVLSAQQARLECKDLPECPGPSVQLGIPEVKDTLDTLDWAVTLDRPERLERPDRLVQLELLEARGLPERSDCRVLPALPARLE